MFDTTVLYQANREATEKGVINQGGTSSGKWLSGDWDLRAAAKAAITLASLMGVPCVRTA